MFIPSYKKPGGGGGYTPCSWSTGSDAEIVEALEAHYNGDCNLAEFWSVGDERTISLSAMSATDNIESHAAQNVIFVLTNVGGRYLSDGTTECAFQVDMKHCLNETGWIEYPYATSQCCWGNAYSIRRTWCNNTYRNAFPSSIKDIFKSFINYYYNINRGTLDSVTDYFSLRAESELYDSVKYSDTNEGSQAEYYTTSSNREKIINGDTTSQQRYWLRSPYKSDRSNYIQVTFVPNSYANINRQITTATQGIATFGVI